MFFSRWPSLLLTVALLVVVGICLKRIDFLLIDEVKAVISIAFGFATSCLLLSLIWVLHRKPMHATWPAVANLAIVDTPNMHPRASVGSEGANDGRTAADCLAQDQPPDYENALIHSKPISWIVAVNNNNNNRDESKRQSAEPEFQLNSYSKQLEFGMSTNEPRKISSAPSDNMTQLALSIVRGFTGDPPPTSGATQQIDQSGGDSSVRSCAGAPRKVSYCQLDVSQLMNQGSPPKYCEITMPRTTDQGLSNDVLSNQSNEPRAGARPDA